MRYIKIYEEWKHNTQDKDLKEVSEYINDILFDISDNGFPYTHPTFINRNRIMFEISANDKNQIDDNKFELTDNIISVLQRCFSYISEYEYDMCIYVYSSIEGDERGYSQEYDDPSYLLRYLNKGDKSMFNFIGVTIERKE